MAYQTRISNVAAKAACDAIVDLLDAGGAGKLQIWNSTQAADPDTAVVDNDTPYSLLAEITLNNPCFGAAADGTGKGTATADVDPVPADTSANKTGTATWFRVVNNAGTAVIDGAVGTSGADLNLNTTSIVSGATVSITSWTFSVPETEA